MPRAPLPTFSSRSFLRTAAAALLSLPLALPLHAAAPPPDEAPEIHIQRATGPIAIDGDLSDAGWQGATKVETFFETNPGDNVPPKVKSVGYLTYDDRYFYAGFEFSEPDVGSLRAPYGDHDNTPSYTDYAGVILDTKHDGKSAILFLVNPVNVQYDAQTNDASGEDSSLDLYWDSATRIHKDSWTLEIRIPFSSLRYTAADPQTWGIL
ncbi:MAG TPA: carbohydrate binding family 9 domain-containing protein, partial [Thermoanaerobaculia bacterium]